MITVKFRTKIFEPYQPFCLALNFLTFAKSLVINL